ncbi:MAG: hypothetical protein PVF17_00345 [Ignavibacteria bacterium]
MADKKKSGIHIKPERKGLFTQYCKSKGYGSVTDSCISEGLASKSAAVRKRANFAKVSKSWKKTGPKS